MKRRRQVSFVALSFLALGGASSSPALAQTVVVDGRANVFGAGLSTPPSFFEYNGQPSGLLPSLLTLPSGTGRLFQVSSVTGEVLCCGTAVVPAGADGSNYAVDVDGFGGVSGIVVNRFLFLGGVFLGDAPLDTPAPSPLDFRSGMGVNFLSLAPQIGQLFFIGDGRQGIDEPGGALQTFIVPDGATRLFLGFADRGSESAEPSFYNDNGGSLTATFEVSAPTAAAPEPASAVLLGTGLLLLGSLRATRLRSA